MAQPIDLARKRRKIIDEDEEVKYLDALGRFQASVIYDKNVVDRELRPFMSFGARYAEHLKDLRYMMRAMFPHANIVAPQDPFEDPSFCSYQTILGDNRGDGTSLEKVDTLVKRIFQGTPIRCEVIWKSTMLTTVSHIHPSIRNNDWFIIIRLYEPYDSNEYQ